MDDFAMRIDPKSPVILRETVEDPTTGLKATIVCLHDGFPFFACIPVRSDAHLPQVDDAVKPDIDDDDDNNRTLFREFDTRNEAKQWLDEYLPLLFSENFRADALTENTLQSE